MKKLSVLISFLFVFDVWAKDILQYGEPKNGVKSLSLIALIANPDKYDGEFVRVEGSFRLEFEGSAICVSKDDLNYRIEKNCLTFNVDQDLLKSSDIIQLNGHYVLVEGIFDSKDTGHFGINSGCIKKIWRIMSLEYER